MIKKELLDYRKLVYKLRWSPELEVEFPTKIDIDKLHARYDIFLGIEGGFGDCHGHIGLV